MNFNPVEEKGIALEKQMRSWEKIASGKFNKNEIDCYSRTRQILMNGIEIEAWNFKHNFARICDDEETKEFLAMTKKIEDNQQTTVNWMSPSDQSVLETTLGYEQVAVDLTAWLAQNEPDEYVRETFDFGLLEDFDHLYRYSQWAYMEHGICPNDIVQNCTDVMFARPTQNHHNCNILRLRRPYHKDKTCIQTKINILTLVSAEQQTHNYYAEHGMHYGNCSLRQTYAEIKDVEEEHVNMYESLICPNESMYEKLLLHEFMEVCTYNNCYEDETDEHLKTVWEEFLGFELAHLAKAIELFEKHENRDAKEIIGDKLVYPCRFKSQKKYVENIIRTQIDKRLGTDKDYLNVKELPDDWASYKIQEVYSAMGSPSETAVKLAIEQTGKDVMCVEDKELKKDVIHLYHKAMQKKGMAKNTVSIQEYEKINSER